MNEIDREYHELSNIFPLMQDAEFEALKADIKQNGLIEPIWIDCDGKIIDGRNRHRACLDTGTPEKFRTYEKSDVLSFIIGLNLHRRHLNETQRAVVASKIANMSHGGDRKNQDANLHLDSVTQSKAATMLNVSQRTVATVKAVEKEAPELLAQMESGQITAHEAEKQVKEKKREELIKNQVIEIETNKFNPPVGTFNVIVIDPPWPYGTKYDPDGRRAANPYPEMSLEKIGEIQLPSADDCVLWLWTTHKFMRHSFGIIDRWGFRDVAIITWVKDRMGLGSWLRSQSEFCIMAVKGKPLIRLTNQTTVIYGQLREHSRKPDEFYQLVDSLYPGSYKLDYFSRTKRDGWVAFGNDTEKFNEV